MKRSVWFVAALTAIALLAKLPHPATDVGKLEPVQVVWIGNAEAGVAVRTDTGAVGVGGDLASAAQALRDGASGVVFLETAELLIIEEESLIVPELYEILRPSCRVCIGSGLDLTAAAAYLTVHPPNTTLAKIRAGDYALEELTMTEEGGSLG